jgi:hypothetical protein
LIDQAKVAAAGAAREVRERRIGGDFRGLMAIRAADFETAVRRRVMGHAGRRGQSGGVIESHGMGEVLAEVVGQIGVDGDECRSVDVLSLIDPTQVVGDHRVQIGSAVAARLLFMHRFATFRVLAGGGSFLVHEAGPKETRMAIL